MTASHRTALGVAALLLLVMGMAGLAGMAVGLGSNLLTLMVTAAVVGPLLLAVPTRSLVWALLLLSFVFTGLASYYGKLGLVHWLPYVVCLWLLIKLPIDALARRPTAAPRPTGELPAGPMLVLGAYAVVAMLSTALNATPILSFLVGAKNYLFVWGLSLVIAYGVFDAAALRRVWLLLLAIAVLQAPFSVQQHFFSFSGSGNWDSVVGTFGGNAEGGGASGATVIYLSILLGVVLALWRRQQLSALWAGGIACAVLLAVAMAEVKAVFVFIPLMVGVVLLRELRERPLFGLSMLVACGLAVALVFSFYKTHYYDREPSALGAATVGDYVEYMLSVDGKLDFISRSTGEVSRLGAPLLWHQEVARFDPEQRWFGFGLRANRYGNLVGAGEAAKHFSFSLTTSTVTALLWDVGVIGLLCFLALLVSTGWLSWRLSADARIPPFHRGALESCAGATVVLLASCLYNVAAIDHFTIQVLLAFIVGYALYWRRQLGSAGR